MAIKYDIELTGATQAQNRFAKLPVSIAKNVGDVMLAKGQKVAVAATGRVRRHPSGLWRKAGSPRYAVKRNSLMSVTVETPGGSVGKAEAISEFASKFKSSQGRALTRNLTAIYGRPGGSGNGRILWKIYDSLENDIITSVNQVVEASLNG